MTDARVTRLHGEALTAAQPDARVTRLHGEALTAAQPDARVTRLHGEVLVATSSDARVTRLHAEALVRPKRILLVADSLTHATYTNTRNALQDAGFLVIGVATSDLDTAPLAGIDVIAAVRVTPADISSWIAARWAEGYPLLIGYERSGDSTNGGPVSDAATDVLGVATGILASNATNNGTPGRTLRDVAEHEVTAGFTGNVTVMAGNNWGTRAEAAAGTTLGTVAANGSVPAGIYMSAVEVGDELLNESTAPARVVYCGWMYGGQTDYTAEGKTLLGQAVTWLATPVEEPDEPNEPEVTLEYWDGDSAEPAELVGWWDGEAIQPVEVLGWWDGEAVQPLSLDPNQAGVGA